MGRQSMSLPDRLCWCAAFAGSVQWRWAYNPSHVPYAGCALALRGERSEEHTSELSHSQISYAVFCLKKKKSSRSEEHTSELQSQSNLVCRLLLEKKKIHTRIKHAPSTPHFARCSSYQTDLIGYHPQPVTI